MLKHYEASGKTVDAAIDAACIVANTTVDMVEIEILEFGSKGLFGIGQKDARVRISLEVPEEAAPKAKAAPEAQPAEKSSFGVKKSKKERFEQKQKKQEELQIEIKPIITADSLSAEEVLAEMKEQPRRSPRKPEGAPEREHDRERDQERPRRESRISEITEGEMAEQITGEAMLFLLPIFEKLQIEPEIATEVKNGILWLNFSGQNMGLLIGRRGETLDALQYITNLVVNKKHKEHVRVILNVEGYREGREETIVAMAKRMADKAVETGRRVELKPMNPHERRMVHVALQNDRRVETASHGEEPYRRIVISAVRPRRDRRRSGGGSSRSSESRS